MVGDSTPRFSRSTAPRAFFVTLGRYGVPMIDMTPIPTMTDNELEDWFAEAGLGATVVDRCPAPRCSVCADIGSDRLAPAA